MGDNPANRLLLVQLLSRLDLDLQEAENGEVAVQRHDLDSPLVSELEEAIILGDKKLIEQAFKKVAIATADLANAIETLTAQFQYIVLLKSIQRAKQPFLE